MRSNLQNGGTLPDFELVDHEKQRQRLSELQGTDPMILVLSRGFFCPKDHQQHHGLVRFYPEIAVSYTRIVTITTDTVGRNRAFRSAVGAQWPFLADPRRVVQKDLDIQEFTDPENDPMIPHTLVLEPGLRIARIYNGYWYWGRPSVDDLRQDLREVFARIRPDWSLARPGLRENWDRGNREMHYPYRARE